ncbi:hypothetical protein BDP27DRAFT_519571 [Rhodocollybia butyracea]|uniref:Uncharacterized protein n=1 Tax=Rhodocollybia butyracea TaxID=206335 RepID=A0A9P5U9X3_9AGAR|nr:hypothetical protein BDP27DRAFT_519571 [Rhodocollybia butyracea]
MSRSSTPTNNYPDADFSNPPPSYSTSSASAPYSYHVFDVPDSGEANERDPLLSNEQSRSTMGDNRSWANLVLIVLAIIIIPRCIPLLFPKSTLTSYWKNILPEETCDAVGARAYTATLASVLNDWDKIEACKMTEVIVHGLTVRKPPICSMSTLDGKTIVQGRWTVDFNESDCFPLWSSINPETCSSYGMRSYHANLGYVPPGLDALASCRDTPVIIHNQSVLPYQCELVRKHDKTSGQVNLVAKGHWIVEESSCTPKWVSVKADSQCSAYDRKRYTAVLEGIPRELDPLETCYDAPLQLFNLSSKPVSCDWDKEGRATGIWYFGLPECRPVLKDIHDNGCFETGFKVYCGIDMLMVVTVL